MLSSPLQKPPSVGRVRGAAGRRVLDVLQVDEDDIRTNKPLQESAEEFPQK